VSPGYLVYLRSDGAVLAAPFDQDHFKLTGPAVPLFEGVMTKPFGSADLAISPTGTLAYVPGLVSTSGGVAELVFVTREGAVAPLNPPTSFNPSANLSLSLSPDGHRVALDVLGAASPDIWVKQLPAGPFSRLTFDSVGAVRPRWTPDGRSVLYLSAQIRGRGSVWRRRADGSAPAEPVWQVAGGSVAEASLSRDSQWLIYRVNTDSSRDIHAVRLDRDTTPIPLLTGRFNEQGAALSPDGRWLAYTSDESGRDEIYVRPFPNTAAGRWQVSTAGGFATRWAHSGRELFYESPTGDFMAVPVAPGPTFNPGAPQRLFPLGSGLVPRSLSLITTSPPTIGGS
jgi:serine/threonine-protein kinase